MRHSFSLVPIREIAPVPQIEINQTSHNVAFAGTSGTSNDYHPRWDNAIVSKDQVIKSLTAFRVRVQEHARTVAVRREVCFTWDSSKPVRLVYNSVTGLLTNGQTPAFTLKASTGVYSARGPWGRHICDIRDQPFAVGIEEDLRAL
jgi:hypothetical protein